MKRNPLAILRAEQRRTEAKLLAMILALLGSCACDAVFLYIMWRMF